MHTPQKDITSLTIVTFEDVNSLQFRSSNALDNLLVIKKGLTKGFSITKVDILASKIVFQS